MLKLLPLAQIPRLALIAKTTSTIGSVSELTKGVDRISTFILRTTLITLLFVVLANVIIERC